MHAHARTHARTYARTHTRTRTRTRTHSSTEVWADMLTFTGAVSPDVIPLHVELTFSEGRQAAKQEVGHQI